MMKYLISTFIIISIAINLTAQEHDYAGALKADSTWGHEYFEFPIRFAREIDYEGMEDAAFPRGWSNVESDEFWSYVFAWDVKLDRAVTSDEIERDLLVYFDGLNGLGPNSNTSPDIKQSTAIFIKLENAEGPDEFRGKVRTYDHFTTKKPITLYTKVKQHICVESGQSMIIFWFSPKTFSEDIWRKLGEVKVRDGFCKTY